MKETKEKTKKEKERQKKEKERKKRRIDGCCGGKIAQNIPTTFRTDFFSENYCRFLCVMC